MTFLVPENYKPSNIPPKQPEKKDEAPAKK